MLGQNIRQHWISNRISGVIHIVSFKPSLWQNADPGDLNDVDPDSGDLNDAQPDPGNLNDAQPDPGDLNDAEPRHCFRRLMHTRELHALIKAYDAILLTNAEIG